MFMVYTPKNLSEELESLKIPNNNIMLNGNDAPSIWKTEKDEGPLASPVLDIDWLLTQPLMPFLVQVAPAHVLHRSITAHGLEDSVEIVEWIRGEQLQKVLDFDIWDHPLDFGAGDVSFSKALSWIRVWLEIGSEFTAKRFYELEEETIILVLSKLFQIIPEGVDIVSEEIQENWFRTADNRFYLKINDEDPESFEILKPFIDALYSYNSRMAASVFAHAAMLVRQESLADGLKWKAARLSDQGFVAKEEAQAILLPKTLNELKKSIELQRDIEKKRQEIFLKYPKKDLSSITHTLDPEITDQLIHFLSSLEPDEGIRYMQLALGMDELKKITGSANIDPSYFYEDDDFISETAEKIVTLCNRMLTRLELKNTSTEKEYTLLVEKTFAHIAKTNAGQAIELKERIARLSNVFVSAFSKYVDNQSLAHALNIVRGALNIGLEYILANVGEFSLSKDPNHSDIETSVLFMQDVGPDFVFQVGWNLIHSLPKELSKEIVLLDAAHEKYKNKFNTLQSIKMSDGTLVTLVLDKLVERRRTADVKKWLASMESKLPVEIYLVLESFFDRVPLLNELVIGDAGSSLKAKSTTKPFETLHEINMAKLFIKNFQHNVLME